MGAIQSSIGAVKYPNDDPQSLNNNDLPNISTTTNGDGNVEMSKTSYLVEDNEVMGINILEDHFNSQVEKLRAYLNMFFLYDGYDNKNAIILKDLKKNFLIQKKKLKLLYEKKDNLISNIDYSKEEFVKDENKNKIYIINILILVVISIGLFVGILINIKSN